MGPIGPEDIWMTPPTPEQPADTPQDCSDPRSENTGPSVSRTPFFEAIHAARYQRQELIKQIQAHTGRRLICYVSGSRCLVDRDDTIPFADLLHHIPAGESIELLLHTRGGNVDAAEKLIRMIKRKTGEADFHIVVPEYAKSAGTLMVLGANRVVMSDASELGPIDPQIRLADGSGQAVQNYLDAYEELAVQLQENPGNIAARLMLDKLDPTIVKLCQVAVDRARQSAEYLLRHGMFRDGGPWTLPASELLDTRRWLSHSQMIAWDDARDPQIGLVVDYLEPQSKRWQDYWRLYCLQRLAITDQQKLYESAIASLVIDGLPG